MADDDKNMGEDEAVALDLDGQTEDLDAAMREAVAAVEGVEQGTAASGETEETDEEEVAKLRREIADLRDRSMRTLADFDNFRKRSERERQETRKYALTEPLREFLEIVDNLGLALSAAVALADDQLVEAEDSVIQKMRRSYGLEEGQIESVLDELALDT